MPLEKAPFPRMPSTKRSKKSGSSSIQRYQFVRLTFKDMKQLFEMYDANKDGMVDYVEFAAILFEHGEQSAASAASASAKKSETQSTSYGN